MISNNFTFTTEDNKNIFVHKWSPIIQPIGVVQIAHGMAEHSARYQNFAEFLTSKGFIVYANDHRGHKETAGSVEKLGFFAHENGWNLVADDMRQLTNIISKENLDLPIFLLGHSMGSLLIRTYITKYKDKIKGVILSGTSGESGFMIKMGKFVAKTIGSLKGKEIPSKLLDSMSFGKFNNAFKPNRTKFDWLSRDENQVDKYVNDPYCGTVFSNRFFYDMVSGVDYNNQKENIDKIPKDLPMLFVSGNSDPVGDFGKGVKKVFEDYKNAGIKNIEIKLYPEARHEILNETNKEEVYQDIVNWIEKIM